MRASTKQELLTDRVQTQVLPTSPDTATYMPLLSGGPEVLVSQDQMGKDISHYMNKYGQREAISPMDSPQKQAYLLG